MLQKEIERLEIQDKPECIWNLDESGFPHDPSKCKHIGPVGAKSIQVTCGANRENTTVLAVCCGDGRSLDPLFIFNGKNLQTSWHGKNTLPQSFYACNDSGWMTKTIFHDWFKIFVAKEKIRPLLVLFDGHMTHLSFENRSFGNDISLVKLPAHCTDVLQPLDVSCFAPLKTYYEQELQKHVHATMAMQSLKKDQFCNMVSKIWRKGLSEENIKSGFQNTGVFPVCPEKYKSYRLDKVKLQSYNTWKAMGSPVDSDGEPLLEPVENTSPEKRKTPTRTPNRNRNETPRPTPSQRRKRIFEESESLNSSMSSVTNTPEFVNPSDLLRQLQ